MSNSSILSYWNRLQKRWIYIKWNNFPPSIGANYIKITILFIGHDSNTLYFTKNVKYLHFKLFRAVYKNADFKWNKLPPSTYSATCIKMTFLFIGYISNTFYSSIVTRVVDHYVLVSDGGVRVSDITVWRHAWREKGHNFN